MFSSYDEVLVAQNCVAYQSTMLKVIEEMSNVAQSCSSCINYSRGKCKRNMYTDIENKIKIM